MAGADAEDAGDKLSEWNATGNDAAGEMIGGLGLRNAAPPHIRKHFREQKTGGDADERRDREEAEARRREAKQPVADLIDGDGEKHGRKAGDDADDDRQTQEQLILAQA